MKPDARHLPTPALDKKNWRSSYGRNNNLIREIAEVLEVSTKSISNWIKRCESEGIAGLKSKPRGAKFGTRRKLTNDQD